MPRTCRTGAMAALLLALATGCATPFPTDAALTAVPYRIDGGGRIVVDVLLDGQGPFAFALDTAASISVVFAPLPASPAPLEIKGREVVVHGAFRSGRFPLVLVRRLDIGSVSWGHAQLAVMPRAGQESGALDGILGNDFLARFAVGLTAADGLLRVYAPDRLSRPSYPGFTSVRLRRAAPAAQRAPLYFLDVAVDDRPFEALLDLGAGINIVNWRAARQLGFYSAAQARRRRSGVTGVLGERDDLHEFTARSLRVGSVTWAAQPFAIGDLPIFAVTGRKDRAAAILGSITLARGDFVVDYGRSRLLVRLP